MNEDQSNESVWDISQLKWKKIAMQGGWAKSNWNKIQAGSLLTSYHIRSLRDHTLSVLRSNYSSNTK